MTNGRWWGRYSRGAYGPFPHRLRHHFEGVIWRFRSGAQWREVPEECGNWQRCRPMAFTLTPGQAADSPQFVPVLAKVRGRAGRPRTRPDAVAGDKAHSSRANRAHLRERGIKALLQETKDQAANRKRGDGAADGRSPTMRTCTRTATPSNA